MTKSKGQVQRRFTSLPDKAIPAPEPERWYPPEPDPALEYLINMPMPGLGRIIGRTQFDEASRLTEFCLTAQVRLAGAWWDVMRVDTCHGEVHAHYMYRTRDYEEREVIHPIYSQNDVDSGYQLAETLLIPDDTMASLFEQLRTADGPLHVAVPHGDDLIIFAMITRKPARHAGPQDEPDDDFPISPGMSVGIVLDYLILRGKPIIFHEASPHVSLELVEKPTTRPAPKNPRATRSRPGRPPASHKCA